MHLAGSEFEMTSTHDDLFKAIADPTRRGLFEGLCRNGRQTVTDLTAKAGISQPAVSKHLGILTRAGLVCYRRDGRLTHYSVRPDALAPLDDWIRQMTRFWESRLDDLESLLQGTDQ